MKQASSLLLLITACVVSGCASNPTPDNYYSLSVGSGDQPGARTQSDALVRLTMATIELPQFLRQQGLVMQMGAHRIESASHHLWAERLDDAIANVLVVDIMAQSDAIVVERNAGHWSGESDCTLRVEFDGFHATDASRVVTKGRFWLYSDQDSRKLVNEFDYSGRLARDGYPQVVAQLRASVSRVAAGIVSEIEASEICQKKDAERSSDSDSS